MIKSIKITNYLDESITMELASPELSGLAVSGIDGLGPVKATINTSDLASMDGAVFNSARLELRSVQLTLIPIVNAKDESINTVEKIRHKVYKYFPIKKACRLTVETDNRIAHVDGYIESNEPKIFEKMETIAITIKCPDPWFYAEKTEVTSFAWVDGTFTFPFSSTSNKDIAMGEMFTNTKNNVYYSGDSETGVVMTIHAIGPATSLVIYNTDTHEKMSFDDAKIKKITGSMIKAGDDIVISTVRGKKHATLYRGAEEYNILNALNRNADWFQLSKGDNTFAFTTDSNGTSEPMNLRFSIDSTVIYEGV